MRSCPDEGRSRESCRVQGFEEILAAEGGEAAADENGVRKLVKLAEFPERVPYDDRPGGDGPFLL